MNSEPKIPTLLGIAILLVGLVVGVSAANKTQIFQTKASPSELPVNITVGDLSSDSAIVFWQTADAASGFVQVEGSGLSNVYKDDRDSQNPLPHHLHFVTITGLTPSSNYKFKINSNGQFTDSDFEFSTTSQIGPAGYQPLIGTVADSSLLPVDEALIKLEIPGAQTLLTITKTAGNFILPLNSLKTQSLDSNFTLSADQKTAAILTVLTPSQTSQVKLNLPFDKPNLPTITLGQNYDLTVTDQPQKILGAQSTDLNSAQMIDKYDLNKDGVVDALDLDLLIKNLASHSARYDLNSDGKVNKMDVDFFRQLLGQ